MTEYVACQNRECEEYGKSKDARGIDPPSGPGLDQLHCGTCGHSDWKEVSEPPPPTGPPS